MTDKEYMKLREICIEIIGGYDETLVEKVKDIIDGKNIKLKKKEKKRIEGIIELYNEMK